MLVHWIWYAMLPKLSLKQKTALLEHFSDPEDIFCCEDFTRVPGITSQMADALENKDLTAAQSVLMECRQKDIGILTVLDAAYPKRLHNIHEPPILLYYKGNLPDFEKQPVIGVVGTRKASGYGLNNARQMAAQITSCGGLVVSGGAGGIDSKALEGALEAGGPAVAVLGCGVDVVYPRNNRLLFSKIQANGCLISEYLPGTEPKPWQFPERNRIISGLSNGVLVVEAPERSGALITAKDAFEQGREVFVVPGNIGVASGVGSNKLLQEYGTAVLSGWDVLREYAPLYPDIAEKPDYISTANPADFAFAKVAQQSAAPRDFAETDKKDVDNPQVNAYSDLENVQICKGDTEGRIMACLDATPIPVDDLIARVGIPAAELLPILTKMALKGMVINHPGRLVSVRNY